MIICFKCDSNTKKTLDDLLAVGGYRDYAELISAAVENLTVLHNHIGDERAVVISDHVEKLTDRGLEGKEKLIRKDEKTHTDKRKQTIPEMLTLSGLERKINSFVKPFVGKWSKGDQVPIGDWIFGQYNKLLPTKVSCRAIAHILLDWPMGVEVQNIPEVAEKVALLGDILADADEKYNLKRGKALSTAFPRSKDRMGKSLIRYSNQFVGQFNKKCELSGLLVDFKLLNTVGHGLPHIGLTEEGWKFTCLRNPVLDDDLPIGKVERFSPEEIEFLLNLIRNSIPNEDYAYRTILGSITQGFDTPNSLDKRLQEVTPKQLERDLTQGFLSSQRSGAISRMEDLGLVTRTHKGVRVKYSATIRGSEYLNEK